ncbi:MAG: HAMP domain-containing sensor histidine kinase [Eubacteriales bacterium]|nr:HAMP domain-containing sensor histidine kinase [Eubacteriales bacterium]
MFKSVFAKYITAFMLIIVISFTILAAIIGSLISDYSNRTTQDTLYRTATNVKKYIENGYAISDAVDFVDFINSDEQSIMQDISTLAMYNTDSVIFITDRRGEILISNELTTGMEVTGTVSEAIFNELVLEGTLKRSDTLSGLFETKYITYAIPVYIYGGELAGSVFVCASAESINDLVEITIKALVMASLWVLLAALIAVYFITDKIIGPLKEMGKAAKSFAAGHFDVRVPVIGQDEVAELATAFNNMAGSLASLEEMRSSFLANVSHDLRTPMTVIGGYIDSIIEGVIPPEKQPYYLDLIANEVRRLSRLVSTLLDITRIQAGDRKFNMAPFDISETARQILISFEQQIEEKKLNVEFASDEDKMFVLADRDAVHQILYNICDNGVKFSREGGLYRISLTARDHKVHVSVYNEGEGIPTEELPHVFDRFYKTDKSRGLDKTGTGLGLYIAKTIIDAHDEEISVKSEPGEYCEFTFTLKQTAEPAAKSGVSGK